MSRKSARRRFAVPIALAAGIVTAAAGTGIVSASGASDLPDRSAAQLLEDVQNSDIEGLSGTVVQNANLGLPSLGQSGGGLTQLADGSNQMRVWYAAPDKMRTAVLSDYGESDTIRNGEDVWTWNSEGGEATHYTLPKKAADAPLWPPSEMGGADPAKAAEQALKAIEPTTKVSTSQPVEVAGRDAYELVLEPKDGESLVDRVTLAIDAEHGVPLRTQVYSDDEKEAAFDIGFSRVDFGTPDKENFTFTAPKGVTVTEGTDELSDFLSNGKKPAADADVKAVGKGWTTVLTGEFDLKELSKETKKKAKHGGESVDLEKVLKQLPEVSGKWGSGRLFESKLVNALLTDDGRFYIGSVTPERLYEVADGK
ncbi:LolA family protein [Stackebrandtia nassauensis]|uniref:MucB/RseB N-terminal domain-containing protein n=1 Tax=Stackebrandtia nassauensis (strain DSM 44728 / CIP 108903 / NRRL B-16338 / NBRC 102104 / LLR-40K-21) TaxID=446470 RepID=D3Q8N9_STANL|nr:outer membrane lipoprotein carrier protein LolA [Stackebrandtia nassauensis]ADD44481.1 hypothetical protein Snas_4840 [Stackebrandtia nassauensis DSM 44728]